MMMMNPWSKSKVIAVGVVEEGGGISQVDYNCLMRNEPKLIP